MDPEGSEPNADLIRRSVDAFNRRDVEALLETFAADVELLPFSARLEGVTYRGPEGVRQWLDELGREWREWRVELDSIRSFGDQVLTTGRIVATGKETSVEAQVPASFVSSIENGRIVRMESYGDPQEAERAAARSL